MVIVKWILIGVAVLVVGGALLLTFGLYRLSKNQPATSEVPLGVENGQLKPCPESPNCVSTQAAEDDAEHYVEPIPFAGTREDIMGRLARWITEHPRAELVKREDAYLRAVFASKLFGFKDDVELYVPDGASVIHLRSASRVGRSDMGVNRKRYEEIRRVIGEFEQDIRSE
jgi:uncharacterized protein (DUF1499 family)